MSWGSAVVVLVAGLWAGTINAVVGSGTLVTFPVLVALGYPPLTATMSNGIGLAAGGFTGAWGYRRELVGQGRRLAVLVPASAVGGVVGAWLLLALPVRGFEAAVAPLVALALVLVVLQPTLQRRLRARSDRRLAAGVRASRDVGIAVVVVTGLVGVYGGYFTAAQGIMLVAGLGALLTEPLQRLNALKNVLALVVNIVSAVFYAVRGAELIDWTVVVLIGVSSLAGGWLGARYGRRLSPTVLRAVIVVLGTVAVVRSVGDQAGWW